VGGGILTHAVHYANLNVFAGLSSLHFLGSPARFPFLVGEELLVRIDGDHLVVEQAKKTM
jgi:hypothetical protein